jgi:hypothetical protein
VTDYFERLQDRVERVPQVCEALLKNLDIIDHCVEELNETVEKAIKNLREYLSTETQRLKQVRRQFQRDLDEARAEVERTMCEEQPKLQAKYAPLLRYSTPESDYLQLFRYCLRAWKPEVRLVDVSDSLMQDYCGWKIPRVVSAGVQLHDLQTGEETSLHVTLPKNVMTCLLDTQTLLCLGGQPELATAQLVKLSTGQVTELPPMSIPRFSAGILKWLQQVFVFGGNDPATAQCERLCLTTQVWSSLSSMHRAKHAFCPCRYEDLIYLPAAGEELEVFSLLSETYTLLTYTIPLKPGPTVAFLVGKELYVLAGGQLARKLLASDVSVTELEACSGGSCATATAPMRLGEQIFWVRPIDSAIIRFNTLSLDLHLVSQYTGPVALPYERTKPHHFPTTHSRRAASGNLSFARKRFYLLHIALTCY